MPRAKTFVLDAEGSPDERRITLFRGARDFFGTLPPGSWIFAEEPLALQNGKTTRLLGLAAGAIWAAHLDYDLYWSWCDVAHWKRAIVGKGNASKDEVRDWCEVNPAFKHENREEFLKYLDLYDAWAIRMHGVRALHSMS